jgi:lysophospholipase L1-like esterase
MKMTKVRQIMSVLSVATIFGGSSLVQAADIAVKSGEKIAFLGDSITQAGAKPNGYVRLVISGLEAVGVKTTAIPAGISGHKSNQMLARLDKHVISKKPDWMTLSCGVNDVWHGKRGVLLEDYKKNITKIVDLCQAADIKVMLLTSTMIKEDEKNKLNQTLKGYNDFIIALAKEKKCLIADLNADMQAIIDASEDKKGGKLLTRDGVHMNADGNKMMATGLLKSFGLDAEQIKKAQTSWDSK